MKLAWSIRAPRKWHGPLPASGEARASITLLGMI
jgi:hypothetical protein